MAPPDPLHLLEITERFDVLKRQESTTYACCDYLAKWKRAAERSDCPQVLPQNAATGITEVWREKICEWSYEVIDYFEFNREVVAVSLSFLDRYLANRIVNKKSFQLVAMTTLYLAIKLYEHGNVAISSFTELSRGNFTVGEIERMEMTIIRELNWYLHPPTSLSFCRSFLTFFPMDIASRELKHDIAEMMRFLCELSVCDYWFVTHKRSSIALAAVTIAVEKHLHDKLQDVGVFLKRIDEASGIRVADHDVQLCRDRLWEMYSSGGYNQQQEDSASAAMRGESPICVSGAPQVIHEHAESTVEKGDYSYSYHVLGNGNNMNAVSSDVKNTSKSQHYNANDLCEEVPTSKKVRN